MYSYIRAVRPVKNVTDAVVVKFGASLIRIIEIVGEKKQLKTHSNTPHMFGAF